MKLALSLLFAALLSMPTLASTDWSLAVAQLAKSTIYIETTGGSCTGFVINKAKHYVLTAAHCDGPELYADQLPTKIIVKDTRKDLMVLEVKDLDRPALALAREDPKVGDEVASYGYGYALERPLFRVVHISDDRTHIAVDNIGGPLFVVDAAFVPGASGGPVVNAKGEVVMIVQLGTDRVGLGVGAETIRGRVGRFFAPDKP